MKHKIKRYAGTSEDGSMVEDDKINQIVNAAHPMANFGADDAEEYLKRSGLREQESAKGTFSVTKPESKPKPKPKPKELESASRAFKRGLASSDGSNSELASTAFKRGQAGPSDSGKNKPLEEYRKAKKAREFEEARKAAAEERKKESKQRVSSVRADSPELTKLRGTSTMYEATPGIGQGLKKGGSVGSASKRADGIAQRGKTRGRVL